MRMPVYVKMSSDVNCRVAEFESELYGGGGVENSLPSAEIWIREGKDSMIL